MFESRETSGHAAENQKSSTFAASSSELLYGDAFSSVGNRVFDKIDSKHDGELTKAELAAAMEDPQFKGQEAQAVAALYQNFDRLRNTSSNGNWFDQTISKADLKVFDYIQRTENKRISEAVGMNDLAKANFSKIDGNHDGQLSKSELQKSRDESKSKDEQLVFENIFSNYNQIAYGKQLKLRDFDSYTSKIMDDTDQAKLNLGIYTSCYSVHESQDSRNSKSLYSDKDPLKSITADAIHQGAIGDCYFMAPLASIASAHPELIKNAIKDNKDGTYTVTFPGAKDEHITVKAPTEAEMGVYNHASEFGCWASVMEKAYGEYCKRNPLRRSIENLIPGGTASEGAEGGGAMEFPLKLLTGKDNDWEFITPLTTESAMAQKLEKALSGPQHKAVTAGITTDFVSDKTADGFVRKHVYSVLGFKPDGYGSGLVTVRNPFGDGKGTTDGTITIPLKKFLNNFSRIAFER